MSLRFYCGSGSPFAWKVWLALEHKELPYELQLLSFDKGDTQSPAFRAINPRGLVPAIVDDGFALWESSAILEYLEDRYPQRPLLPKDAQGRAIARRIAAEAHNHLQPAQQTLFEETLYRTAAEQDQGKIAAAQTAVLAELTRFESMLKGEFFTPSLSLADFTAFPYARLVRRVDERQPGHGLGDRFPAQLAAWMRRIEALPYYAKTIPPHWKT